jgi:hypothetical protein
MQRGMNHAKSKSEKNATSVSVELSCRFKIDLGASVTSHDCIASRRTGSPITTPVALGPDPGTGSSTLQRVNAPIMPPAPFPPTVPTKGSSVWPPSIRHIPSSQLRERPMHKVRSVMSSRDPARPPTFHTSLTAAKHRYRTMTIRKCSRLPLTASNDLRTPFHPLLRV